MASSLVEGATQFGSLTGVSYSGLSGQGSAVEQPARSRQLAAAAAVKVLKDAYEVGIRLLPLAR